MDLINATKQWLPCIHPNYYIHYNNPPTAINMSQKEFDSWQDPQSHLELGPPPPDQQDSDEAEFPSEPSVESHLKRQLIFWGYFLIVALFLGGSITLTVLTNNQITKTGGSDLYYFGNQVVYDWSQGYVNALQVKDSSAGCDSGWEAAFAYQWPGSGYGCACTINSNVSFVVEGYCTPQLIQQQCTNVKAQLSRTVSFWKNNSLLCVKRSSSSFMNSPNPSQSTKICGSSTSLVVVSSSEPCPLVNVSYSSFPLENHMSSISSSVLPNIYAAFDSTSPFSFYSYPIIRFRVDQYDFCLMDQDIGVDPDHNDFVLLNIIRGCASTGNYTKLDNLTEAQFYTNNPTLGQLSSIKGFPKPGNWEYKLGFLSQHPWTYKCRYNYQKVYSTTKAADIFRFTFKGVQQNLLIVLYLCYAFLAIELLVLFLRRIFKADIYPVGFKKIELPREYATGVLRIVAQAIVKALILGTQLYCCIQCYQNWQWLISALNLNCPDSNPQLVNSLMKPYQNVYRSLYTLYLISVAISVVILLVDILHYTYIYRTELRFYLQNAVSKKLVSKDDIQADKQIINDEKQHGKEGLSSIEIKVDEDAQFRDTMAKELFDGRPDSIVRKKKKKPRKFGTQNRQSLQMNNLKDDFNPYQMDDPISGSSLDNKKAEGGEDLGIGRARNKLRRK